MMCRCCDASNIPTSRGGDTLLTSFCTWISLYFYVGYHHLHFCCLFLFIDISCKYQPSLTLCENFIMNGRMEITVLRWHPLEVNNILTSKDYSFGDMRCGFDRDLMYFRNLSKYNEDAAKMINRPDVKGPDSDPSELNVLFLLLFRLKNTGRSKIQLLCHHSTVRVQHGSCRHV